MPQDISSARFRKVSLSLTLLLSTLIVLLLTGLEIQPRTAGAQLHRLSAEKLEEYAHQLGLHWHGSADEGPVVVNFGGEGVSDEIAGLDQWLLNNSDPTYARLAQMGRNAVTGAQNVMVLRVYFNDYAASSRYSRGEVEGFFDEMSQLWKNTSYGNISISARVTDLYQLPDNRSAYVDDFPDGDLSEGDKYWKVLGDAIANAPAGLDWDGLDAIMVVMAETGNQFHRGQGTGSCNLRQGPGGPVRNVGCAIFSENPSESDLRVWGRWSHEIGHAFQVAGPAHPSNYNSLFEQMDALYPGQTGVFSKLPDMGFPGWMPEDQYRVITPLKNEGEQVCLRAMEYDPMTVRPVYQAIQAKITDSLYYMVSVRRAVLGDDLWDDNNNGVSDGIPDEGVLIERVVEGADQWVTLQPPPGRTRNSLWQEGEIFTHETDGIRIEVLKQSDEDTYCVAVTYNRLANQPDVALHPWRNPPGETWETTDIWVDSPVNGYGVYRYGHWNDLWGNPVPRGNGDDPAIGMVNHLYARVRNVGTAPATDVTVHFDITDPPGVGINGANGWALIGSVDKNTFPGLASIEPGGYVDVFIEWVPDFPVSEEDLAAGRFYFHTCVRVRIDPVAGETVFGNQDGDGEQENINYFQAVSTEEGASVFNDVIRLRNDDVVNEKFFNLTFQSDLPQDWVVLVNNGQPGVRLAPNEVREIPVLIKPQGQAVIGSVFGVDIQASSLELLVSDLDPKDVHPADQLLSGARVEARVMQPVKVECQVENHGEIRVWGKLHGIEEFYSPNNPPYVLIQGLDGNRRYIPMQESTGASQLAYVNRDGSFEIYLYSEKVKIAEVVCLFAGTTELASAGTGYIPVPANVYSPLPTPTAPLRPTWTPVPAATPTPGPTATPTPISIFYPVRPPLFRPTGTPVAIVPPWDLGIHGIEITQGIQCFDPSRGLADCPDNSLPVVTQKATAARVYLRYTDPVGARMSNVPVRFYMRQCPHCFWEVIDGTGPALPTLDQSSAENSVNFVFTVLGNQPAVVDFYAVVDPDNRIAEFNENNNRWPSSGYLTMTFHPTKDLRIRGQRLRWNPPGPGGPWNAGSGNGAGTSGWTVNSGGALWLNQMLPIRDDGIHYTVQSGFREWAGPLDIDDQHVLIERMNGEYVLSVLFGLIFGMDLSNLPHHWYAWIPNNRGEFGHADMPVYPHAGGLGVVGIGTDGPGNSTDNPGPGALIFGHEVVHNYDVFHTNTGDSCGSLDGNSDFPYGNSSIQEFGFNPLTQKVYNPANTHDLMSYCPAGGSREGWISPFTWQRMFDELRVTGAARASDEVATLPGGLRLTNSGHAESLVISLSVFNESASGQKGGKLGDLYKLDRGYNLVLPPGDEYAVEMRSAQGETLSRRTFAVSFESEYHEHDHHASAHSSSHSGGHGDGHGSGPTLPGQELLPPGSPDDTSQANLTFVMPWVEGTSEIVLLRGTETLDMRLVSDAAPVVAITQPAGSVEWPAASTQTLAWSATDADTPAQDLRYTVFYSHDLQSWTLLASGLTENNLAVEVDSLAGGPNTRFRVVATDGVNTGHADTPGSISVPNKAPVAVILEPAPGRAALPGELIALRGGAMDLEDGQLTGEQLHWISDRQGSLGRGGSLALNTLEPGLHTITLQATDSLGITHEEHRTLFIGYQLFMPTVER